MHTHSAWKKICFQSKSLGMLGFGNLFVDFFGISILTELATLTTSRIKTLPEESFIESAFIIRIDSGGFFWFHAYKSIQIAPISLLEIIILFIQLLSVEHPDTSESCHFIRDVCYM